MKILIDECVPYNLLKDLRNKGIKTVFTVRMMGWDGYKNGELIKIADNQFDVFITIDKNLKYQQNLTRIRMAIMLLSVQDNRVATVLGKSNLLISNIESIVPGQFIEL
jgi:predicted nuclease of predicted toxin-antitoxin system